MLKKDKVTLTESDSQNGVFRTFELGYYLFRIDKDLIMSDCLLITNNVLNVCPHPHVSSNSICAGNLHHLFERSQINKDSESFFNTLDQLLDSYNFESPYSPFLELIKIKNVLTLRGPRGRIQIG